MNSSDRVNWAHRQTDRDLIQFALHRDNINLDGHECYAVMMVLACRLGDALDRSDFEASALDFDPDDRPIVAEACTDLPARHVRCGEGPYPLPIAVGELGPNGIGSLARARRLHAPVGQEDTALAELERNFQIP
jgi:hypothetical protein